MIITDKNKLTSECKDVSFFEAKGIISKLEEELYKSETGIGLSANQININAKVCIIKVRKFIAFINPVILELDDKREFYNEGCLSFPGQFVTTVRANEVFIKDLIYPTGVVLSGLEAVAAQHEVGHLYGELMYDYEIEIPQKNEKCWCRSNRKYKKCCLGKVISEK